MIMGIASKGSQYKQQDVAKGLVGYNDIAVSTHSTLDPSSSTYLVMLPELYPSEEGTKAGEWGAGLGRELARCCLGLWW